MLCSGHHVEGPEAPTPRPGPPPLGLRHRHPNVCGGRTVQMAARQRTSVSATQQRCGRAPRAQVLRGGSGPSQAEDAASGRGGGRGVTGTHRSPSTCAPSGSPGPAHGPGSITLREPQRLPGLGATVQGPRAPSGPHHGASRPRPLTGHVGFLSISLCCQRCIVSGEEEENRFLKMLRTSPMRVASQHHTGQAGAGVGAGSRGGA